MKKFLILAGTAALALLLTACNKEEGETVVSDDGTKSITVTVTGLTTTKSTNLPTTGDDTWVDTDGSGAGTTGSAAATTFDIYFTDGQGVIQYVYSINSSDADYSTLTSALTGSGIRFINLENISAVYVTANAAATSSSQTVQLTKGSNISGITASLVYQNALVANSDILYIGADKSLELNDETTTPTVTVDAESGNNSATNGSSVTNSANNANQYYAAKLAVRPIISRLEIAKIEAQATGTTYKESTNNLTAQYGGQWYEYCVTWEGFKPTLVGIYMSNFYGTIDPVTPAVDDLFATPSGDKVLTGSTYLWDATSAGIGTAYNVDGISLYTNGDGSSLFGSITDADPYVYFDGSSSNKCVPFNFLVPFDITNTTSETAIDRYSSGTGAMTEEPVYHFLFYVNLSGYSYKLYARTIEAEASVTTDDLESAAGSTASIQIISTADESGATANAGLYSALTSNFNFNSAADGYYYVNLTSLSTTSGSTVVIQPNKIYKLATVSIAPYNLTTSTEYSEYYNFVVEATVVDYIAESVTANFNE